MILFGARSKVLVCIFDLLKLISEGIMQKYLATKFFKNVLLAPDLAKVL